MKVGSEESVNPALDVGAAGHHLLLLRHLFGQFNNLHYRKNIVTKNEKYQEHVKEKMCQSKNGYSDKYSY